MSTAKPGTLDTSNPKSSLLALAEAASGEPQDAEPVAWTLPSGEDLLHFALNGGFLAPNVFGSGTESTPERRVRQSKDEKSAEGIR